MMTTLRQPYYEPEPGVPIALLRSENALKKRARLTTLRVLIYLRFA